MSVNVAKRRGRAQQRLESALPSLPIGEIDQTIFACPACARPLAVGTGHCPGCGTRLVLGVQARRASIFVAVGLAAGLLVGAAFTTLANAIGGGHSAAVAPLPTAHATASPRSGSPSPASTPVRSTDPAVSPISGSALVGAIAVDGRLAASQVALHGALAAKRFDVAAVSQNLRALSADAVIGLKLTPHLDAWAEASPIGADLTALYTDVQMTAGQGLSASIRNEAGYRAAATQMVSLLKGLPALDSRARDLAFQAGLILSDAAPAPAP